MATFLELCQAVARDSGTVSNLSSPSTVTGQTGRLQRIVNWTREAYNDVQTLRNDWRWLRDEFEGNTISGVQRYDSAAMNISSRFGHWLFYDEEHQPSFYSFKTSTGRSDEGALKFIPWANFRRRFLVGAAVDETGKPAYVTVDNDDKLVFYPTPDADYTISGEYYKGPQTLSADGDIPEMPEMRHDMIKWGALLLMGGFDEAFAQDPHWRLKYVEHKTKLIATQTPRVGFTGPLA